MNFGKVVPPVYGVFDLKMNFGKVVLIVSPTPYLLTPPPHFLEIGVGSLGGDEECVGTLSFVCAFCLPHTLLLRHPLLYHPLRSPIPYSQIPV